MVVFPVKISVVSYTNSLPFVYGLNEAGLLKDKARFSLDIPKVCAQKLLENKVDLGLVPVAVIPRLKEAHIVSDFCISARGPVKSVMLYSNVPLEKITRIFLDYQSMTSVNLTRVLAKNFWKISPEFVEAPMNYTDNIVGTDAGVVIGDRTFSLNGHFNYEYDLSNEWMHYTGMPFVFACWVSNKPLSEDFVSDFNRSLDYGVNRKTEALKALRPDYFNAEMLDYLESSIHFRLDNQKKTAMNLFLKLLSGLN